MLLLLLELLMELSLMELKRGVELALQLMSHMRLSMVRM
jgi:hypothetical protein